MKKIIVLSMGIGLLLIMSGCFMKDQVDDFSRKESIREDKETIKIALQAVREPIKDTFLMPFPRLAMWWLEAYEESAESMARYDLLLNEFDDPYLWDKLEKMRQMNPKQILLRPLSPSERGWYTDVPGKEWNPAIEHLPTSFFLMHQGAKLITDIDRETTSIKVDRLEDEEGQIFFYEGDTIAIGRDESARIIEINKKKHILVVERGFVRGAKSHKIGERVQTHVRFWPETWVMNITAACPKEKIEGVKEPVDYIHYYHLLTQNKVENLYDQIGDNPFYIAQEDVGYDGFIIDRFEDHQSWLSYIEDEERKLDPYRNDEPLEAEKFDELVMKTVADYTALLRDTYGEEILLIRNNAVTKDVHQHEGQVYESFGWDKPSNSWWKGLFTGGEDADYIFDMYGGALTYLEWFEKKENALIYMEVYEDEEGADSNGDGSYKNPFETPDFKANEQRIRFSLTSTLLGDGFYSYEINTNGHGTLGLMWPASYDKGGERKGYLGYPIHAYKEVASGIYIREYEKGIVVVNATDAQVNLEFDQVVEVAPGFVDEGSTLNAYDGSIFLLTE